MQNVSPETGSVNPTTPHTRSQGIALQEGEDFTAVWAAARSGDVTLFRKALKKAKKRATFNEIDKNGRTALHIAVTAGHTQLVNFLIDKGADLNIEDNKGWTCLHCATSSNQLELAKLLLQRGAAVFERDGSSPLHYLVRSEQLDQQQETALAILKKMIAMGLQVTVTNEYGLTPLHDSVSNSIFFTRILLEYGANPNAKNKVGEIPLHTAVKLGNHEMIGLLLHYGADPRIKSPLGTSFDLAMMCHPTTSSSLIALLRGLLGLADDILFRILDFLSLRDLTRVSQVCSQLGTLSTYDELWMKFYKQKKEIELVRPKGQFLYKEVVSDYYRSNWHGWVHPPVFSSTPSTGVASAGAQEKKANTLASGSLMTRSAGIGAARGTLIHNELSVTDLLLRIMLIGDPSSGKSAYLSQFLGTSYEPFPPEGKDRACKTRNVLLHEKKITLQIWEQALRNRSRMLNHAGKSPYRSVNGVIVFCNVTSTESVNNLRHWLEDVRRFSANSSGMRAEVILVATHCNASEDQRKIKSTELEALAEKERVPLFETSGTNGHNVHFSMRLVVEAIYAALFQKEKVAPTLRLPEGKIFFS